MRTFVRLACMAALSIMSCLSCGCGGGYTDNNVPVKVITDEMIKEQLGGSATIPGEEGMVGRKK